MTNRFFAGQTNYIEEMNALDGETGDHIADPTAAHAASAISNTPAGNIAATTVQGAIDELDSEKLSASATTLPASFTASSLTSVGTLTSLTVSGATTLSGGTANGVAYLDGSKVLTTGNAITFDGANLGIGVQVPYGGVYAKFHTYEATGSVWRLDRTGAGFNTIQSVETGSAYRGLALDASEHAFRISGVDRVAVTSDFVRAFDGTYSGYMGKGSALISGAGASEFAIRSDADLVLGAGGASRIVTVTTTGASLTGLLDLSNAASGQIKFPATQNASADANTLDDYQEATYTGTATGMTTSPTGTVSYTLTGNEATLNLPEITGTSNDTTFTVTGMPAEARPATRKTVLGRAQDNGGAIVPVRIDIETTGVLTIYANADAGAFTASGSKTLAECSVTYTRV